MTQRTAEAGFEAFFRAEYTKLVAIGRGLTGSHELGADLAQETLLRCHRDWARVSTLEAPGAWARRVLVNLSIDAHRAAARGRRVPTWVHQVDPVTPADPAIDDWWNAVRALPDRQRAVVVLHYLEDRSIDDIARTLDIAPGTVKSSLARARAHLARTIEHDGRNA
jgi:RNA polymerase sigma-70 factor (ECF subfamily)